MRVDHIALCACLAASLLAGGTPSPARAQAASVHVVLQHLQSRRVAGPHAGPLRHTHAPSLEGSRVEYVIITDAAMASEFERLAQWKTQKGVPTIVRTLDDVIEAARAGSDLAETLRNYIRDAYLDWGVQFVLLGGDTDVIPARYVEVELLNLNRPLTELYYACLDGNWNADGDAFFGEPGSGDHDPGDSVDLQAEVFVGRAPVSTVAEAAVFVDKTLRHEWPLDTGFQSQMLLLAEVLFPSDWQPGGAPPTADGGVFAEEILSVIPQAFQTTRYYEAHELWDGTSELNLQRATEAFESGYGTIVHIGHGYRYTLSLADGSFDVPDADRLANGVRAGLFYMLNCTATAFDFDSMAEALLLNPNGGATLVVGAAREAFPLAARGYQTAFFHEAYVLGERRVGAAMARSRQRVVTTPSLALVDLWTQLVYTLLGDPEAPLWLSARDDLVLSGVPAALEVGSQQLSVRITNGDGPVANAVVCVFKEDDDYRVARTDAAGDAVLDLQLSQLGDVTMTVTAVDHVPLQLQVPVSAAAIALGVGDVGLQDDGGAAGFGNKDGVLDAGETVRLTLPLHNAGGGTAAGLAATLYSEEASVEVLQAISDYDDLGAAEQAHAQTPFEIRVAESVADGEIVRLRLEVQHAGGAETRWLHLPVAAARLQLFALRLDDSRAGNNDGVQDPGEEIDLYYSVINRGGGAATLVQLQLTQPSIGLEVLNSRVDVVDVQAGARTEASMALTIREIDVAASRQVLLELSHRQLRGGEVHVLETRLPDPPTGLHFGVADAPDVVNLKWNPNAEDDHLGYNVYRSLAATGPFDRINSDVIHHAYFRDAGLDLSTRYHYRVGAVDAALFEGRLGTSASASTNPPQLAGWPLPVDDFSASTPAVGDILGNGETAIVSASRNVFAWDANGAELRDADHNAFTWGLFFGDDEVYGAIALADMDPHPGREIVVSTWDAQRRHVTLINGAGESLPGWPQELVPVSAALRGSHVAPVVANVDGNGAPEVFLAARDGRLYGWHADGSEIADGDENAATHGVLLNTGSAFMRCAPGVADLDPFRPGLEVVVGSSDGVLYVVGSDGAVLPGWPRSVGGDGAAFGAFLTGPAIADLDRDGRVEMVFLESQGRLHAMHVDGSEVAGFPVSGLRSTSTSIAPSVAIGDLLGDDALEIVAATTTGDLHIFDAAGNALLPQPIVSGGLSESSPILGDVDGDGAIEIVFGNENGAINAWNLDGTAVDGFPIAIGSEVRATPVLADVRGDGSAALVIQAWGGTVNVFDLNVPWNPALFPWPMHRGNIQRTGEYGFEVPTPVVVADLRTESHPDGRVVLSWSASNEAADLAWSIHRAGPFDREFESHTAPAGPWTEIANLAGRGAMHFVDRPPFAARWYVYAIAATEPGSGDVHRRLVAAHAAAPAVLRLHPAFPNPFNPGTRLTFEIPIQGATASGARPTVRVDVFDIHGRLVRTLLDEPRNAGTYRVDWDGVDRTGRAAASGVYIVQLRAGSELRSQKVVRLR